ncbi:hydroxymethylbilane synthase [Ferrovum sp. PN-J185]|uniref:hydroxymethylbilane synthase n=1 Tax=Ferrovum sp. PN-J185 TaxID=1356306 RepID=UPI0007993BF0|nr:hydroxymethylbilane synthase [Ferrovum sp. PN-J185]KXW55952.1 porphobilinogen deaminase [Ferrovum sp. PN-J185]MCC6068660.1 hydroxymethylbilane synthase [Ferrovum sp. PN-J185]MDE1891937.1 hydroxymethylbilane synthase [Betaproteobacteria bacterium]MDE2056931.1 hydroxymethylbilane synthase [Betaproteobacteria bacterium]
MSAQLPITIATRESRLALWQAEHIRSQLLQLYPQLEVSLLGMTTQGDQILDRTLSKVGGKGLFVKELEIAMEQGKARLAVHSMKDVPMELPPLFNMIVVGEREEATDAFISNKYTHLSELPNGAVVGTSSLRRECQLRERYPHLTITSLRGNLDTRLRKLDQGEYDAIILASAGLKRLGLGNRIKANISLTDSIPAVGQGALAIEFRHDDKELEQLLQPLINQETAYCVLSERTLSRQLAGSCDVPLGAHATINNGQLTLHAFVGRPDGSLIIRASATGRAEDYQTIGLDAAKQLIQQGAQAILDACRAG